MIQKLALGFWWVTLMIWLPITQVCAHDLVPVVQKVSSSIVGIGVYDPLAAPRATLMGSGFAIGDGTLIVTNNHVVAKPLDEKTRQRRVVFIGKGNNPQTAFADIVATDALHDLAILKIQTRVEPLTLAGNVLKPEGTEVIFSGFPIGAVLGLYPATHRGIIAAQTPVINPSQHSSQLDPKTIRRLRDPYFVYQLDATAYPGNSGSAVIDTHTAEVIAIINKTFVKNTKESVLSDPSGITYAIPVRYLSELLETVKPD